MSHPMPMSTYPIEQLLQLWRVEELTVEQVIGHLLQHSAAHAAQAQALQTQMQALQTQVQRLQQRLIS